MFLSRIFLPTHLKVRIVWKHLFSNQAVSTVSSGVRLRAQLFGRYSTSLPVCHPKGLIPAAFTSSSSCSSSPVSYLGPACHHEEREILNSKNEVEETRPEVVGDEEDVIPDFSWLAEGTVMKVLNVAEKNDAAKRISALLSGGTAHVRNTYSTYNKNYEFPFNFRGQQCTMSMTSVSGHLLGYDFGDQYRKWYSCDPVQLFDAPVIKSCPDNFKDIKRTLEGMAPFCKILIIWTDCDREGENIGFEVIDVCKGANPRLEVYRAKFSEITPVAVNRAINNLIQPNKRLSDAVDVRSELDLRIGAAFTRFQTMRLQTRFPNVLNDKLISYGSCQFPTLGFVVERYKAIESFIPEKFWKIEVSHLKDGFTVDFNWARVRLFNQLAVQVLFEKCEDNPRATVIKVQSKPKSKWRPTALDTVEFEKLSSRKLKIGAKEAMKIAEKLYTQGIISYPRTETNIFPQGLDLRLLIEAQTNSNRWGDFAGRLLQAGPTPRNGKKTDEAHPPIHPTRFDANLNGNEARVYELIVRHFLACCSKDAIGTETTVEIDIAEERFVCNGLRILERNYLEVYPYDKWSDKELPGFDEGETFRPTKIAMTDGDTSPPNLLTEADLISLMEKHGIGTDATHAEHIETIKQRMYVGVNDGKFVPGQLGMGLVEGYDAMGFQMSKPHLRSELEADLKKIGEGRKDPGLVLREQVQKYKEVFIVATDQVNRLDAAVGRCLDQDVSTAPPANGPAPRFPGQGGGGFSRRGGGRGPNDDDDDDGGGPPPAGGSSYAGNSRGTGDRENYTNTGSRYGPPQNTMPRARPTSQNLATQEEGTCHCGIVLQTRTVVKDNENKGRPFRSCSTCGTFDWLDEKRVTTLANDSTSHQISTSSSYGPTQNIPYNRAQMAAAVRAPLVSRAPVSSITRNNPAIQLPRSQKQNQSTSYPPSGGRTAYNSSTDENRGAGIPNCCCEIPAISLTVKKDGGNKGRLFFGCSKSFSAPDRCNFFKWDDEGIGAQTNSSRNRGNPSPFDAPGSSNGTGLGLMGSINGFSDNRGTSKRGRGGATGPRKPRKCGLCHEEGHTRRNCPMSVDIDAEEEDLY